MPRVQWKVPKHTLTIIFLSCCNYFFLLPNEISFQYPYKSFLKLIAKNTLELSKLLRQASPEKPKYYVCGSCAWSYSSYSREDLCAPACGQREEARSQVTSRIYCSAAVPRHWHGDAQDDRSHHSRDELCRGRSVPLLAQTKDAQHQHASAHHLTDTQMERWWD